LTVIRNNNTNPVGCSRTDIEVNAENVADPCEDNRITDDDIFVRQQKKSGWKLLRTRQQRKMF
jgi:hypothetical protein